jgi:hypothetical protein
MRIEEDSERVTHPKLNQLKGVEKRIKERKEKEKKEKKDNGN